MRRRKARARKTHTPTATATVTPTATPALNLTAEDSVAPVTCNGPKRPVTTRPFLTAPYRGAASIVSIFDHDSPNFMRDGLTIATTGAQAMPDATHHRSDFPAYWNGSLRLYLDYDGHNGYDYDLYYQPVYAAAAGKVIFAAAEYPDALDHGYGNMVMIDHRNGYVTLYGHFSKILVKVGQKVKRGQKIGISGNTGHSTGPHLHFTVFHNCSPTDPYGWSGGGDDPLTSYAGETSVFLWKDAPEITNPLPNWPGLASMPAVSGSRRVLLRLPSPQAGAAAFERSMARRAATVVGALRRVGVTGHVDLLRGAVWLSAAAPPALLLHLPYVQAIEGRNSVDGAKAQVLSELAAAEVAVVKHRAPLGHSPSWTGYLVKLAGRTVLVGSGTKGREVALRLPAEIKSDSVKRLHADARNGLYAVDLGKLSSRQYSDVARALRGPAAQPTPVSVPTEPSLAAQEQPRNGQRGSTMPGFVLPGLVLLLCAAAGTVLWFVRPRADATE